MINARRFQQVPNDNKLAGSALSFGRSIAKNIVLSADIDEVARARLLCQGNKFLIEAAPADILSRVNALLYRCTRSPSSTHTQCTL
jgi:hypothetical protein